jgi:hypothetical protein
VRLRRGDGYGTACEGRLKLTRRLSEGELAWVEEVLATGCWGAGRWAAGRWKDDESDTEAALTQEAEAKNDARCGGPRIFHVPDHADFRAQRRGFIVRAGMEPHKAGDLRSALRWGGLFVRRIAPWGCPLAAGRAIRYIPRPGKRP